MNIHYIIIYTILLLIVIFMFYNYRKLKPIIELEETINKNFIKTNEKFELVNKAVTSLDENLEKANKIEKDVQELKTKIK